MITERIALTRKALPIIAISMSLFCFNTPAFSAPFNCDTRINNSVQSVQECMTIERLVKHLKAFQKAADQNKELPGTRFIGTSGYDASRNYIVKKMTQAGYNV